MLYRLTSVSLCLLFLSACPDSEEKAEMDGGLVDAGSGDGDVDGRVGQADAREGNVAHLPPTAMGAAYFSDVDETLQNQELVDFLHAKLRNDHKRIGYDGLEDAYAITDTGRDGCSGIFDFYSDICWDPSDACGNYNSEGDCYNKEHSWPKSWWGGSETAAQYEDLISVIPSDGYVNNRRGQLPFGEVVEADYISGNGSRRGTCDVADAPSGDCFEPADELKGDLARIYFYVAVRYSGRFSCCQEPAVNRADIKPWQEAMLKRWHREDPVDEAEREREMSVSFHCKKIAIPLSTTVIGWRGLRIFRRG